MKQQYGANKSYNADIPVSLITNANYTDNEPFVPEMGVEDYINMIMQQSKPASTGIPYFGQASSTGVPNYDIAQPYQQINLYNPVFIIAPGSNNLDEPLTKAKPLLDLLGANNKGLKDTKSTSSTTSGKSTK